MNLLHLVNLPKDETRRRNEYEGRRETRAVKLSSGGDVLPTRKTKKKRERKYEPLIRFLLALALADFVFRRSRNSERERRKEKAHSP